MKIFFDLDGTLIDSRPRMYKLFQTLLPQSNLSYEEYWSMKRSKVSHESILKKYFADVDYSNFHNAWMSLIETKEYLDMDFPFQRVTGHLMALKESGISIYVTTARQFRQGVLHQFENFGWTNLFVDILVTEQKFKKEELIRPYLSIDEENWIIGDTGYDIQVAKQLKIKSAAVLSGFLSEKALLDYKPDIIIDKITDFNPYTKYQDD